jgi:Ca2+-binding RTX toxin-like protein
MVTHSVMPITFEQFNITSSVEKWVFEENTLIRPPEQQSAIYEANDAQDNIIILNGIAYAPYEASYGVELLGKNTHFEIGVEGEVISRAAVNMGGNGASMINRGSIESQNVAIFMGGDHTAVVNNGTIIGESFAVDLRAETETYFENNGTIRTTLGIGANADKTTMVFGGNSDVLTDTVAVGIDSTAGQKATVENHGLLKVDGGFVIYGDAGREVVINRGTLDGDVRLGGAKDVFDNIGGTFVGDVFGGEGNDVYKVDSVVNITELDGQGRDTIKSSVSQDLSSIIMADSEIEVLRLTGTDDIDAVGNNEDNRIFGNAGDNQLTGGGGDDVFVFKKNAGTDTITDFEPGDDRIDFRSLKLNGGNDIDSFSDLIANHAENQGGDVLISFGGNKVLLENTSLGDLNASDFLF